jgi:hypothetical protein
MAHQEGGRFRKRRGTITLNGTSGTCVLGVPGFKLFRVVGFRANAYTNSSRLVTATDTATQIELKDSLNRVFYKDAADKDYSNALAGQRRTIVLDDTLTGLGFQSVDSLGGVLGTAGQARPPVVEGPVTVTWSNGTTTEFLVIELLVEV